MTNKKNRHTLNGLNALLGGATVEKDQAHCSKHLNTSYKINC